MLDEFDLADRFSMMPDLKTITYYAQGTSGTGGFNTPVTLQNCERRELEFNERMQLAAELADELLNWHVWQSMLAAVGIDPAIGDKLVDDDGDTWHVIAIDRELIKQRWKLSCRKERQA